MQQRDYHGGHLAALPLTVPGYGQTLKVSRRPPLASLAFLLLASAQQVPPDAHAVSLERSMYLGPSPLRARR
jgi:hypothetical protein